MTFWWWNVDLDVVFLAGVDLRSRRCRGVMTEKSEMMEVMEVMEC